MRQSGKLGVGGALFALFLEACTPNGHVAEPATAPERPRQDTAKTIPEGLPREIGILTDYLANLAVSKGKKSQYQSRDGPINVYELDVKAPNSDNYAVIRFTDVSGSGRFELGDRLMAGAYVPGNLCARAGTGVEVDGRGVSHGVLGSGLQWKPLDTSSLGDKRLALTYLATVGNTAREGKPVEE
jgi:hypothetical protein